MRWKVYVYIVIIQDFSLLACFILWHYVWSVMYGLLIISDFPVKNFTFCKWLNARMYRSSMYMYLLGKLGMTFSLWHVKCCNIWSFLFVFDNSPFVFYNFPFVLYNFPFVFYNLHLYCIIFHLYCIVFYLYSLLSICIL
jgi:hypothetical protein